MKKKVEYNEEMAQAISNAMEENRKPIITVEDKIGDMFYKRGILRYDVIDSILEYVKPKMDETLNMPFKWGDPVGCFPEQFYAIMFFNIELLAAEWCKQEESRAVWLAFLEK